MPELTLERLTAGYGATLAVREVDLRVRAGEVCVVLGPNGAGKSTLAKAITGELAPRAGSIAIDGEDVTKLDRRALARRIALVPQEIEVAYGFTVREVVAMGRAPHQGAWLVERDDDRAAIERAIEACSLRPLAARLVEELSGGEQKRVAIARALAQEAGVLVLDEASAHLDVRHAVALQEVLLREVRARRLACVAILHDLNAAAQIADQVVLLKEGRVVASGSIEDVMTYAKLKDLFETELYVGVNELDNARYFLPVAPRSKG